MRPHKQPGGCRQRRKALQQSAAVPWISNLPGNLNTNLSATFHPFVFGAYAKRYLGGGALRFNRRLSNAMAVRIANSTQPEASLALQADRLPCPCPGAAAPEPDGIRQPVSDRDGSDSRGDGVACEWRRGR